VGIKIQFKVVLLFVITQLAMLNVGAMAEESWPEMSVFHLQGEWTDHENNDVNLEDFSAKPLVVAMVYISCQYSCPMVTSKVLSVRQSLPRKLRSEVTYALISFDSERDTPEVLNNYKKKRKLDEHWVLLTGNSSSVRNLAAVLGVNYKKMADGEFSHSNVVVVLDRKGVLVSRIDRLNMAVANMSETLQSLFPGPSD